MVAGERQKSDGRERQVFWDPWTRLANTAIIPLFLKISVASPLRIYFVVNLKLLIQDTCLFLEKLFP